jgi:PKD repeat protein
MHAQVVRRKTVVIPLLGLLLVGSVLVARARRSTAAGNTINTVATIGDLRSMVVDGMGNAYIGTRGRVYRMDVSNGALSVIAGNGTVGQTGDGGPSTSATVANVDAMGIDGQGNLYLLDGADQQPGSPPAVHRVRKIDAVSGVITQVIGDMITPASPGGAPPEGPSAMTVDPAGNVYVGWSYSVLKFAKGAGETYTVIAGNGSEGDKGGRIGFVGGLAVDKTGTKLAIADSSNFKIRVLNPTDTAPTMQTVAGTSGPFDHNYPASTSTATLGVPTNIEFDAGGNLFIVEQARNFVTRLSADFQTIDWVIGDRGGQGFSGDGGDAKNAELFLEAPGRGAVGVQPPNGNVLLMDGGNNRIRLVNALGVPGGNGRGTGPYSPRPTPPTAGFNAPSPVCKDATVKFTNSSSGATSYSWDFGDGGSSTEANPSHTYTAAGTVTVTLTATNSADSATASKQISVGGCEQVPRYWPVTPIRALDTRSGPGSNIGMNGNPHRIGPGETVDVDVAGFLGRPADQIGAVAMNVTAVNASEATDIRAYPTGEAIPNASNVNVVAGEVLPNLVVVKVGAGAKVTLRNAGGTVDLVADITGWFDATSDIHPVSPTRALDTRVGTGAPKAQVPGNGEMTLDLKGVGGVPSDGSAGAVVMNVTVTNPTGEGHIRVYPSDVPRPNASNLNFSAGETIANLVITKLGADGTVKLYNGAAGPVDLIADVLGWFPTSSGTYGGVAPTRLLDTRVGTGASGAIPAGGHVDLTVTNVADVPGDATAVILNVTGTEIAGPTYITVFPTGEGLPLASNLNLVPGDTVPNLVIAKVGAGGRVTLYNSLASTQLIADVVGYMKPPPAG